MVSTQKNSSYKLLTLVLIFFITATPLSVLSAESEDSNKKLLFPRPFAIAIDDLGWMEGSSLGNDSGPWRAGVRRSFDVRDYIPIVEIGKAVGVRFQGLFILGELDRLNIIAEKCPTASQYGRSFDNSPNVSPRQFEIMSYVKSNAAFLEFGLHGVGHEFWVDGVRTRAEWYDLENKQPRDEEIMRNHLDCFVAIMAQYGITPENGHTFPESFVPCAYGYYWNPNGSYSTGKLMSEYGVKYVNTLFAAIAELNPPLTGSGGFDNGVLVIDRHNYGNPWYELASLPRLPVEEYETDIIETHWPNLLAADDFLQTELNNQWISYLRGIQRHPNHYLAKNTEQFYSQWLYRRYTAVEETTPGFVKIDNRSMPDEAYEYGIISTLVFAVPLNPNEHVSRATLNGKPVTSYFEDEGYGYIYLPPLSQDVYTFEYGIGATPMPFYVHHTGTYNVYAVRLSHDAVEIDLKMYGTQDVEVRTSRRPRSVRSSNEHLRIDTYSYDSAQSKLILTLSGRNIQGETGTIHVEF